MEGRTKMGGKLIKKTNELNILYTTVKYTKSFKDAKHTFNLKLKKERICKTKCKQYVSETNKKKAPYL